MGKIDYKKIYDYNRRKWEGLTDEPEKYEALLAGHYSDSNHFIYELLQNAEDADATKVVVECYADRLVFFHNGTPFNEDDVIGVSSMLMGTKAGKSDKNTGQKIGHFGMGFKSVFKYTNQPEVYSDNEAFRIERYLLPVELNNGWDFETEKESLKCKIVGGKTRFPFKDEEHLTKFIIPFTKKDVDGNEVVMSSKDVIAKLRELDGRILLFLSTIKELYWIDKTTNEFMLITLAEDENDHNLITCRKEGSKTGDKEEIDRFLKFTKVFDHEKMTDCNVSIAFKVNRSQGKLHIAPLQNQYIWVYFPTKDETKLPFLIHGAFETAVSREKLMEPSAFNNDLYGVLIELFCDSLRQLRDRELINQSFIRQILLPAFEDSHFFMSDYEDSDEEKTSDLQIKVTEVFKKEKMLPTINGGYCECDKLFVAVPYTMAEFKGMDLFSNSFGAVNEFVQFGDNSAARFNDYYLWLKDELHIPVFTMESWAKQLLRFPSDKIEKKSKSYDELEHFYDFISDYREALYGGKTNQVYLSRTSSYEVALRSCVAPAWEHLRQAPIVLNKEGKLVASFINENANVYLNSSSQFKSVNVDALVDDDIVRNFKSLLEDGLHIAPFNNYQFVKEKIIQKYVIGDKINFDDEENSEQEYLDDLMQILNLLEEDVTLEEFRSIVKDAYIIRVIQDDNIVYGLPRTAYLKFSEEEIDMSVYMDGISADRYPVDLDFYQRNGIDEKSLKNFGLFTKLVDLGIREYAGGPGDPAWRAKGEYCPKLDVKYWDENVDYIIENSDTKLAKEKSAQMLFWVLRNYKKLVGEVSHNKTNTYTTEEKSGFYNKINGDYACWDEEWNWLYNANEELVYPKDISKFELNTDIYGAIEYSKEAYEALGFVTKDVDETADTFNMVEAMDNRSQEVLFQQLARKLGYTVEKSNSELFEDDENDVFDPNEVLSADFPVRKVKNMDSLQSYVRQQFFCADPIRYKQVLRQIRVSKNSKMVREYVSAMYTNYDGVRICQMCKKPVQSMEAVEIAHLGIEMDQLHLALCPNCAAIYKGIRDKDKNEFKASIIDDLKWIDLEYDSDDGEYQLWITDDESIWFNQTHLAEIQEILQLVDKYGLPGEQQDDEISEGPLGPIGRTSKELITDSETSEEDALSEEVLVVREGAFITYKKLPSGDEYDNVIQSKKFPLHKALIGAKKGDVVRFMNKEYQVIEIIYNE